MLIFLPLATITSTTLYYKQQPEPKPCVVDQCEDDVCVVETPEGWVQVDRKPDYYEGKRLPMRECPIEQIEPR